MKFTIMLPQDVEIDDALIPDLCRKVNKRFENDPDDSVYPQDLVQQAILEGHLDKPESDEWEVAWSEQDNVITKEDWEALEKPKRKSRVKSRKQKK